jgi:hypothetical protein
LRQSYSLIKIRLAMGNVGRDNSVGIANPYGLGGWENELQWRRGFPHPSRPVVGPT